MSLPLTGIRTTIFRLVKTHRLLFITFGFVLCLGAVGLTKSPALREMLRFSRAPEPAARQQSPAAATAHNRSDALKSLGVNLALREAPTVVNLLAPTVSATKTDSLFTDVDGDSQADPGDTIKYTVNINAAGEDATGVTFTDTVDPNTAFVPGSLRATPVAVNDSYSATGNVRISVAAPGVLGNDFGGLPSATITGAPSTSANGGNVAVNADGSFTYNPPAGFEGTDTFTYTLTNSEGSNSATVTVNVSGMIWFIDNNATACTTLAAGCGRLTDPFSSLLAFAALNNGGGNNPAANDNIFVYESASDYAGPVTLLNGQKFIGQDATASLSSITGLTPPAGSDPLPATNSANGVIVNITTGDAITVASGNTLRGFTGGNSTTDITGSGFGTLTISDVTLNGNGQALDLTNGTLAASFVSISSNTSAATGVSLSSVGGSLTSPTTTITDPTGIGISVGSSSASLNFGNTTASASGNTGVSLLNNSGAITFGALNISPDAGQRGLLATDNSNTITATSGTISNTGATAVEITRASGFTPLVISLTSVSSDGAANGITLNRVNGSFTVTGTGTTAGSGGTIQNKSGNGVDARNASNITLTNMNLPNNAQAQTVTGASTQCGGDLRTGNNLSCVAGIYLQAVVGVTLTNVSVTGSKQMGINGNNVTTFTMSNSTITGNGDELREDGLTFQNLKGTSSISNSMIKDNASHQIQVTNIENSSTLTLGITGTRTNNTFPTVDTSTTEIGKTTQTNLFTDQSLLLDTVSTATNVNMTLNITGVVFKNNLPGNSVLINASAGAGSTFGGATTNSSFNTTAGGVIIQAQNAMSGDYDVTNSEFNKVNLQSILYAGLNPYSGALTGTISGNHIGEDSNNTAGVACEPNPGNCQGIVMNMIGGPGSITTLVDNNRLQQFSSDGILVQANGNLSPDVNVTITNNTIQNPAGTTANGIRTNIGTTTGANVDGCLGISSNSITGTFNDPGVGTQFGINTRVRFLSVHRLPGYVGSATAVGGPGNAVTDFIIGNNSAGNKVFTQLSNSGTYPGGAACSGPPALTMQQSSSLKSAGYSAEMTAGIVKEKKDVLYVADGERADNPTSLQADWLNSTVLPAAIERWRQFGISAEDLARLQSVTLEVTDLPDGQLASATSTNLKVDSNASGYGWYFDMTAGDDAEFDVPVPGRELQTTQYSLAHNRGVDILTVVMRQLGFVYLQGGSAPKALESLMQNTLSPGVRRLPNSASILVSKNRSVSDKSLASQIGKPSASQSKGTPVVARNARFKPATQSASQPSSRVLHHAPRRAAASFITLADVMLSIGTLPAGESVTITFNATVDNPFTGAVAQVANQGTVSGSNFADVLTDDPDVGGAADPTVTPIDLPDVSVTVSPSSVLEDGPTNLVYTFTRDGSTANAMTVNFSVGGTASFTEPDYTQTGAATFTATSGTVVIPSGSATATVTIDPAADPAVEADETVDLTVTSGTGYSVGSPSLASGTITNDDTSVSLAVSPSSVAEDGATNLVYTFTRVGVTSSALAVNFSVGGTADFGPSPDDYTQTGATSFTPPTGVVTFAPGSSTAQVTVNPEADSKVEPDETVDLTITAGSGYTIGTPASASGTITNDDTDVSVAVSPASVAEDGATNLVYTFTRNGVTGSALVVNFTVGGTATFGPSPNDYTQTGATTFAPPAGTVTFAPGSSTATVTVDPEADTTAEADETVSITLAAGAGYNVITPSSATGTILNDDTIVSVAVSPTTTSEGGPNLVYTFTRTGPTTSAVTVNFSVGGTASYPSDYAQSGAATFTPPTATVTIPSGSSTAAVTVTPLTDCAVEGPETVQFTVQAGTGYGVGSPSTATGTINNTADSTPPVITLIPNVNMTLWPPNHNYQTVAVTNFVASASDNCDASVNINSVYITKITSDEAEDGAGDGNTLNDIVIAPSCKTAQLRAERSGSGDGRVYTITFKVVDSSGNFTTATAKVTVRTSPGSPAVDSGVAYTVNGCP
jgi:Bacterial Ig domain/Calx-beta domain